MVFSFLSSLCRPVARSTPLPYALAAICLLAGCTHIPAQPPQPASHAIAPQDVHPALAARVTELLPREANGFHLMPEPDAALDARLEMIQLAQHTLDLQYFIWNADESGLQVLNAIGEAVRRGVRVRILLDHLHSGPIEARMQDLASHPNVDVRMFNPVTARAGASVAAKVLGALDEYARIRHRMHNKLLVIDNALALTGGRNIGDEYLTENQGNFFDLDILAAGPIVNEMSQAFDTYWNSALAYSLKWDWTTGTQKSSDSQAPRQYVPLPVQESRSHSPVGRVLSGQINLCRCEARLFVDPVEKASARSSSDQRSPLHEKLVDLFLGARSSIHVVSPYFVRGKDGLERIRHLVARGVRVEVLTNSLATTDVLLAHVVYARYRHSLLEAGMNIRELAAVPGRDPASAFHAYRLHAKLSVIDESWLYVGSLNFTKRSEHLNTEMGVILDCPVLARDILDLLQSVPSYDLRLARNPVGLEWVYKNSQPERVLQSDPGASAWQKFRSAIVNPFVPEGEI